METFLVENTWIIVLFLLWTLPWKGAALWRAARRGHAGWFIVLLVMNTLAILDILYLFVFGRKKKRLMEPTADSEQQTQPISDARRLRTYQDFQQQTSDENTAPRPVKKIM